MVLLLWLAALSYFAFVVIVSWAPSAFFFSCAGLFLSWWCSVLTFGRRCRPVCLSRLHPQQLVVYSMVSRSAGAAGAVPRKASMVSAPCPLRPGFFELVVVYCHFEIYRDKRVPRLRENHTTAVFGGA